METAESLSAIRRLLVAGGAVAASQLNIARAAHAYGSDEIKIGLVGCGGRGTGAAAQAMNTEGPTKLVAVADAFADKAALTIDNLAQQYNEKVDVPAERQFSGFDAYQKLLQTDTRSRHFGDAPRIQAPSLPKLRSKQARISSWRNRLRSIRPASAVS